MKYRNSGSTCNGKQFHFARYHFGRRPDGWGGRQKQYSGCGGKQCDAMQKKNFSLRMNYSQCRITVKFYGLEMMLIIFRPTQCFAAILKIVPKIEDERRREGEKEKSRVHTCFDSLIIIMIH